MECAQCKEPIPLPKANWKNIKFCSRKCSRKADLSRYHAVKPSGLSHSAQGAMSELIAAVDLMRLGYEVFRALSPDCKCDLAIVKDGRLSRIQARTGHLKGDGTVSFPKKLSDSGKHDHYAVVLAEDGTVLYIPPLPPPTDEQDGPPAS